MDWLTLLVNYAVTIFLYLLVPAILCLRGTTMPKKTITTITIINGICVWILFRILGAESSTTWPAFIWSGVGYALMKRKLLLQDEENESTSESTHDIHEVAQEKTNVNQPPQTRYCCSICGGLIDNNTRKCTECGKQYAKRLPKTTKILVAVSALLIFVVVFALVGLFAEDSNDLIEYESYYAGIRTITVDNEATAKVILKIWENNGATEEAMVALLNEYGASQGGSQLYLVEQGEWIDEVDAWCFDRSRKIGDVAIIKNDYGYTICYFSSVVER